MTEPTIAEVQVTLLDVWRILEDMDRNLNERFDRIEGHFDAMCAHLDAVESRTGALLDSVTSSTSSRADGPPTLDHLRLSK